MDVKELIADLVLENQMLKMQAESKSRFDVESEKTMRNLQEMVKILEEKLSTAIQNNRDARITMRDRIVTVLTDPEKYFNENPPVFDNQRKAARMLGITQGTISHWLCGRVKFQNMSLEIAVKLLLYLKAI